MKKIISLVLTVMLIFAAMPTGVFTATATTSGTTGACTWTLDGTSLTISGDGAMEDYSGACQWNTITNLIIEDGITYIGANSFSACKSLTSVSIPDSVTGVGNNAFDGCISLKKVYITSIAAWCGIDFYTYPSNPLCNGAGLYLNDELLTQITIPNSIINMMNYTFAAYSSLTSVTISNGVKSIGRSVFDGCSSLEGVTIPNSVSTIGAYAFYNCGALTTVNLGYGITKIKEGAFYCCKSLTEVYYNGTEAQWNTIQIISNNECLTDAEISFAPDASPVEDFDYRVDYYSYGEGIIRITGYKGNGGEVVIPPEIEGLPVMYIDNYAFDNCDTITSITIPNNVANIGDSAFRGCSSLKNVIIPSSVNSIASWAFGDCSSLENVYITDIVAWCNIAFGGYRSNPLCNGGNLYLNNELVTEVTFHDGVTSIGEYVFNGCTSIKSITIPDTIRSIGICAFEECSNLENIYITDIVTWCNIAFSNYSSNPLYYADNLYLNNELVTNLTLPDGVTNIGNCAFACYSSLVSVKIPDSVTSIGDSAFRRCSLLTDLTIGENVTSIGDSAFLGCSSLMRLNIPDSVTSIGDSAFSNCDTLTKVIIGKGVTSIGTEVFKDCSSMISITIPESVTSIGDGAFWGCSSLTSITIPNSVTDIGNRAFLNCRSLKNVIIPESVTSIGNGIFQGCSALTDIDIPNTVTGISFGMFSGCSSLASINIPDSVAYISYNAFFECSSLTSINIPDSVTCIDYDAFNGCYSLKDVYINDITSWCNIEFAKDSYLGVSGYTNPMCYGANLYVNNQLLTDLYIPDGITIIDIYRFYGCKSIENIFIPKSTILIKKDAFNSCTGIKNVYFEGTAEEWAEISILSGNDYLQNATVYYNSTDIPGGVISVEITKLPDKVQYIANEESLDLTGGVLTVNFDGGATQNIDLDTLIVDGFDNSVLGKQKLIVKYGEFSVQFEVEVIIKPISFVAVSNLPFKIEYKAGEDLDLTGGKIAIGYPEGNYELFNITTDMVSGFNKHKIGIQVLAVNYGGFSAQLAVTVTPAVDIDFNGDGNVNVTDAVILRNGFLNSNISDDLTYDINGDSTTNAQDIVILKKLLAEQI